MGPYSTACEVLPQGRWKLSQGNKISSNYQNNIVVKSSKGDIILDIWIKTHDGWVAGVNFLCETDEERVQSTTASCKKNINDLHIELGHPSKSVTCTTTKDMGIQVTSTFKLCEDCALGKAKQQKDCCLIKKIGERLFFDIPSPSTPIAGKKHWILVIVDSSDYK